MRALSRNQSTVYYALLSGTEAVVDDNFNRTGEYITQFGNVTRLRANVSASRGSADLEQFGINFQYSKTMTVCDLNCPIDETTALWLDMGELSSFSASTQYAVGDVVIYSGKIYACKIACIGAWNANQWETVPRNFYVAGVAKSLNSITYALREVVS